MLFQTPSQQVDPIFIIISPILMVAIFITSLILIRNSDLTRKKAIALSIISFIGVGILLNARPNPVNAINQMVVTLSPTTDFFAPLLFSSLGVLTIMLVSVVFFSRIFCGYVCPLGSMQELTSLINFKSSLKEQRKVKYKFDPSIKIIKIIRWIYFGVFVLIAFLWGLAISQNLDPFNGFQLLKGFSDVVIVTIVFLSVILIASVFIYRPWCRILCPFGALSNLITIKKPKYNRTSDCIDCGLCEKICPSHVADRHNSKTECYFCNRCVEICPHDAIKYTKQTP